MDLVRQTAAVGAVLALLAATLAWLRRRGLALPARKTAGRRLECLERLSLGPQHTLHLVRVGGTELLLASTPAGCSLVNRVWVERKGVERTGAGRRGIERTGVERRGADRAGLACLPLADSSREDVRC